MTSADAGSATAGSNPTSSASATSSSAERDDLPNGTVNTRAWASLGPPVR